MHRNISEQIVLMSTIFVALVIAAQITWLTERLLIYGSTTIVTMYFARQIATFCRKFLPYRKVSPLNKAVLITGCDSGFGHSLARRLYQEGYMVFACCLSLSGEGAKSLQADHSPNRMVVLPLDVTKDSDIASAVEQVKYKLHVAEKTLWAVINNAGIASYGIVEMESIEIFEKLVAVNQLGVVRITKAFLPLLRQSSGRVIVVVSGLGRLSIGGVVPYCMTKHAVIAFCDGLRREIWPWGVKVITVEPGLYRTNIVPDAKTIKTKWAEIDPCIRDAYGEEYVRKMIELLTKLYEDAPTDTSSVIESLLKAVHAEYPDLTYKVAHTYSEKGGFLLTDFIPTKILDLLLAMHPMKTLPLDRREWIKRELGISL